jgi:hypothetical protein
MVCCADCGFAAGFIEARVQCPKGIAAKQAGVVRGISWVGTMWLDAFCPEGAATNQPRATPWVTLLIDLVLSVK